MSNYNVTKNKTDILTLIVGRESSQKEINAVKDAFAGDYEIKIINSYFRFSEDQLPFIVNIAINLASAGIYDFLKAGIKKLQSSSDINRKKSVIIRKSDEQYIFSEKRVCIRKHAEDIEFDSINDLFKYIQK